MAPEHQLHISVFAGAFGPRYGDTAVKNDHRKSSNGKTDLKRSIKSLKRDPSLPAGVSRLSHATLMGFTHQTHSAHPG